MRKIIRQMYFYEVEIQKYDEITGGYKFTENFKKDAIDIFKEFTLLPFDKNNLDYSMYLKKPNGTYDFVKVDSIIDNRIEGKLINSDDSGLTYYEDKGELKFLKDTISQNLSIAEISHFVFFLDSKILMFEYNAKSSHSASLINYIKTKTDNKYYVKFKNLLNKNKKKRFNSIQKVKSFKFMTSSKLLLSDKVNNKGFFKAARAALDLTQSMTDVEQNITIEIKPKRIKKDNKQIYYDAKELKESINEISEDINNNGNDFKLDIVGINELNERIVVNYSRDIITEKIILQPNEIQSKNFYEKMREKYNKVYNDYIG